RLPTPTPVPYTTLFRSGPMAAGLHVRKLIAQRSDAAGGEPPRDRFHECMPHAGAGAMGEHIERPRLCRLEQQGRDLDPRVHADTDRKSTRLNSSHEWIS